MLLQQQARLERRTCRQDHFWPPIKGIPEARQNKTPANAGAHTRPEGNALNRAAF